MTLEPPSEEEDDTVVESTESESDPAELFKQQHFELHRNLVSAKDQARRRGAAVLNQNSLHVKTGQEEERKRGNIREGAKLTEVEEERKTPEHKSEKVEKNHFKTSSSGERRRPVENGREERRKETKIDENCDNCDNCGEEVKRILEELENIKRRISDIEHDVLNRIVL